MKNFLNNIRTNALMTILVLAVGSISIVGTSQFVRGLDGGNINGSVIGCVYGACKDTTIGGGSSSGGDGGGGQPTPNTATLIVTKKMDCPNVPCVIQPQAFTIIVTGNNPSPDKFKDLGFGTRVTLGPGGYTVSEEFLPPSFTFSGDCDQNGKGTIAAGETQECTITNTTPL